jgi:hypothetical protein
MITRASSFDFLDEINIQCHGRLVEEKRIMDIEALKREARENLKTNEENRNQLKPTGAGPEGTNKPSKEVAKRIADLFRSPSRGIAAR